MRFDVEQATSILSRTPSVFDALLHDLPDSWVAANEGDKTWSPFDVVGHLVHCERTDWIPRARLILEKGESQVFDPVDRFAHFQESCGKSIVELLNEFAVLRPANLSTLGEFELSASDLQRTGRHPDFGVVTLGQLLATWVVHDLGHIAQTARVMAKQYANEVGPWAEYVPVLRR